MFEDDFTQMLRNYSDAVDDRRRFFGLMRDCFPGQAMQINLINTAYDLEIVKELKNTSTINNAFAFRFVKRLVDEYGVSRLNADWAISVWCVCYGQLVLKKPCEIRISKAKQGAAPAIKEERGATGKQYGDLFSYVSVDGGYGVSGFVGSNKRTIIFSNRHNNKPVKRIMPRSFAECEVQEAVMTDGLEVIGESAFSGCGELKQVIFPTTLKELNDFAFSGCTNLITAALPEGVEQIGRFAFSGCSLKSITIPKSVYWLGEGAFSRCNRIEKIELPDNIISVPDKLFEDCTNLKMVSLPGTIGSIGKNAFAGCSSLENIVIPDTVKSIGEGAFDGTNQKFTLLCYRSSAAEQYARDNNITFQIIY